MRDRVEDSDIVRLLTFLVAQLHLRLSELYKNSPCLDFPFYTSLILLHKRDKIEEKTIAQIHWTSIRPQKTKRIFSIEEMEIKTR